MAPTRPPEQPVLWLGPFGFDPAEQARLADLLVPREGGPTWRLADPALADAWLVQGARVQALGGGRIRVDSPAPGVESQQLDLKDVTRPLAFALPVPDAIEPLCVVDLGAPASVQAALQQIEVWLKPLRTRFALGQGIVGGGAALRHRVVHLTEQDRLLAVLDFRTGQAALAPDLHPAQVAGAEWIKRPATAGDAPAGFLTLTIAQLSWTYVRHTDAELLPAPYSHRPIYYRGSPRVPLDWLTDSQLALLGELSLKHGTLDALCDRSGLPRTVVLKDLTCLYFASAITSTAAKSASHRNSEGSTSASAGGASVLQGQASTGRDFLTIGVRPDGAGPPSHSPTMPARFGSKFSKLR